MDMRKHGDFFQINELFTPLDLSNHQNADIESLKERSKDRILAGLLKSDFDLNSCKEYIGNIDKSEILSAKNDEMFKLLRAVSLRVLVPSPLMSMFNFLFFVEFKNQFASLHGTCCEGESQMV